MLICEFYSYDSSSKRATIFLKVRAASSRNYLDLFAQIDGKNYLKTFVKEPPTDGRANDAIIKIIAKSWKLRQNQLKIIKGKKSNIKILEISDIDKSEIENKLKDYAGI